MSDTLYTRFDMMDEDDFGTIHERVTTIAEVVHGHFGVLAEFRRRPGRWLLWIDVDHVTCPDCGENSGRYVQFAFLEDGASVIGECCAGHFLHDDLKYSPDEEDALRDIGWKDPDEVLTRNWHLEVTSDDELLMLSRMTERTFTEVFGLDPGARAVVKFQERIMDGRPR